MKKILVIGIGAGDPGYMTMQAIRALNEADVFFVLDKGSDKEDLAALRREICDRFVDGGQYRIVHAPHTGHFENRIKLTRHDLLGAPCVAVSQGFPDTQNRPQTCLLRSGEFCRDLLVRFRIQRAALRVPDQHILAPGFGQHRRRNLAGVGARLKFTEVLRSKRDFRARQSSRDLGQIRKWNAYRRFDRAQGPECGQ